MIFLTGLWNKFYGYILAAGAAMGVALSLYLKGRSDARASASAAESKKRLQTIEKAKKINEKVDNMSDADLDDKLSKWMRD